jgi:dTDP-4-dehydrorhamnose reductase
VASTKSILIVGGSGFLGTHLALKLRQGYNKVFATFFNHSMVIPGVTFIPCNVENRNWVKRIVYATQPNVVIYLAGKNDVAWSEQNGRTAELVHSSGPATLANFTEMLQPRFIFVSNPFVFDGSRGNYRENDTLLPGSTLGRMKLGGENVVRSKSLNHVILRSSPLFGRGNGANLSFMDRLRMKLDRGERIETDSKELFSFAPTDGFCDLIQKVIDSSVRNRVFHYGGLTKTTLFEFGREFAKRFRYDPQLVIPKAMAQGLTEQEKQSDFSLNVTQTIEALKIKPLLLEEGFDLIEKKLVPDL